MNTPTRLLFPFVTIQFFLFGCSQAPLPPPMCRVDPASQETNSANAGCLIELDSKLLVITHRTSGKLDIPGGTANSGESAQCTAHRETFEETGFNVEVGRFLGSNEHQFRFYACTLDSGFTGEITEFPVPEWADNEVSGINLISPSTIKRKDWRFPEEWEQVKAYFTALSASNSSPTGEEEQSETSIAEKG